ncbi:MAG: hypothetical protein FWG42_12490 [Clostridiales bacterium]|nr:hypothetical protein [Clostridiales bacterium]
MKSKIVCMLVILTLCIAPCTAFAAVPSQNVGDRIMTWALMADQLKQIDAACADVELFALADKFGPDAVSESGKPLYVLKMGDGDTVLWIQAQIHGNEKFTTIGLMEFIWEYAENAGLRAELENLTIYAIPIYNPDGSSNSWSSAGVMSATGAQRGTFVDPSRRRATLPSGTGSWYNYDLNRDWKVNLAGETVGFGARESVAYYKLFCEVMPDYSLDLHHQGAYNRTFVNYPSWGSTPVTMSFGTSVYIDGPTLPYLKNYNAEMKQIQGYVYDQIKEDVRLLYGYTNPPIDMYDGIEIFGGVVSGMILGIDYQGINPYNHSCPATFFESETQIGNTTTNLTARYLNIAKQNYLAVMAYTKGMATGDIFDMNPEDYYAIPYRTASRPATPSSRDYNTAQYNQLMDSWKAGGGWHDKVRFGLATDGISGIEGNVEYGLKMYGAENILALELEFVIDGPLSGIGVNGLAGFEPMNDIFWTYAGDGAWKGSLTLKYESGDSTGFSKPTKLADVATFVFAPTGEGDAILTLTDCKAVALDGGTTKYVGTLISVPEAATSVEKTVFSKYDLNRDGIVDALDLGIMLLYCGFRADDPEWGTLVKVNDSKGKPVTAMMCDVNDDDVINMLDLIDLFINYTK